MCIRDRLYIGSFDVVSNAERNLLYGDFSTGDLSLGQTQGTVSVLNALAVAGDLYLDGVALTNDNGTLTWNGSAVGAGTTFTGGTVANATTFSSNATVAGTLAVGNISDVESSITTNTSNITSNDTDIATNASNIASNITNIATNASNITSNDSDIASNTTNISGNATEILTLSLIHI